LNKHREWPKRGDDLAFGMGQVLTAPCHINFIKLQLRNWTDLLELCEQQKIDEIRTVEHEEPV